MLSPAKSPEVGHPHQRCHHHRYYRRRFHRHHRKHNLQIGRHPCCHLRSLRRLVILIIVFILIAIDPVIIAIFIPIVIDVRKIAQI